MDGGGRKWGFTEVSREDQIPYVGREKCTMDGDALEEEASDDIWQWDQPRNFKVIRHVSALFQAIIGAKESIKVFIHRGEDA